MSSGLVAPPGGGEELCEWRREVGCQWESPQQETREVGCQSDWAPRRDAGVQVDLMRHLASPSPSMLLQCFSVRSDGPDGGALLQHCTTTRTRTIRPAIRLSPKLRESRTQRRPPSSDAARPNPPLQPPPRRRRRRESPDTDPEEGVEDTGDPNWTPPADGDAPPPSAPGGGGGDSPLVKLELESIMCDVCGKVMKNKSSLARHSFIHTGKKPFACQLCDLRFNRRDNLQHHLTRLHPNGVSKLEKQRQVQAWLCAVCGKTFNCRSRLKAHEVVHSGVKPHRCDLCPKAYMRINDLEHHKKSVHVPGASEPPRPSSLLCDLCGKEFKCRSQLVIHFQTHTGERPHLCDTCGRKFARQHQLKRHKILIHAKQRRGEEPPPYELPFACSVCGKRLKSKALLAAHSHVHSSEKPHRCGVCLRSFQRATCLKQHHLRVHLKVRVNTAPHAARYRKCTSQAKMFPCPICSKMFKFKSLLSSHSLIHSELRPYACDFCSRSFRRLSHLKRHREVVHANGARPPESFICSICGKDKKCRSQLDRHVIIHTGERPFACSLCSARFNRSGNLQQHRKRMHGEGKPPPPEEAPPLLFDDDMTCKQEETVEAAPAERFQVEMMMEEVQEESQEETEVVQEEVQEEVQQEVQEETQQEVQEETQEETQQEVQEETEEETQQEVQEEVQEEVQQEVQEETQQEVQEETEEETQQEETQQEVQEETQQEVQEETEEETQQEVQEETQQEVQEEVQQEETEEETQQEAQQEVQEETQQELVAS